MDEKLLIESTLTKLSQSSFKVQASVGVITLMLFNVGGLDEACSDWVSIDVSLKDVTAFVDLA